MNTTMTNDEAKKALDTIVEDLTRPIKKHTGLQIWGLGLLLMLLLAAYGYYIQLRDGLGVTAMRDYVSWGLYIANFVFFVAVSLVGMLISAVLGLLRVKWITPITRIAEIIALAFVMLAGIVIVIDMGRPDRLLNVLIHGRLQSPILWDVTVITTYLTISLLLLFLPLIPDIAILRKRLTQVPKWQWRIYNVLSLGWVGTPLQYKILHRSIRMLLILIIPVALAIHTVTSWLFASTLRPGWDTTIFGPYFVTGAFVAGTAAVIILMFIFRNNFKLKNYITEYHFDSMAKLLVLVSLVYLYFNINEFLVPAYKMKAHDAVHLKQLFVGSFAAIFWFTQIVCLIIPIILLIIKPMRRPISVFIISIFVLLGAWLKRYLIVVPTMLHPHLPIQNVPVEYSSYLPTGIEIGVTMGTFAAAFLIITILSKLFPVISIWETAQQQGISNEIINQLADDSAAFRKKKK